MDNWWGGLWPRENPDGLNILLKEIKIARKLRTKICFYGIDINSMNMKESKNIWSAISREADFMTCRNERTTRMLKELSCNNIYRTSDVTFGLLTESEKNNSKDCLKKLNLNENGYVIWAVLMPWPTWEYNEEKHGARYHLLVKQLIGAANSPQFAGLTHVFMPFHYQMELPIIQEVAVGIKDRTVICDRNSGISIDDKRLLFKYAKQCVVMKFHGAMFSIFNGTPAAVISYSEKTNDVLREFGLEEYFTEYGIRETQDFYRCFDLNYDDLMRVINRSCEPEAKLKFDVAGKKLRSLSEKSKGLLVNWVSD